MFWGLGLWGYITSYKGISTNFVLREPSVYQNISDCQCLSPCIGMMAFTRISVLPVSLTKKMYCFQLISLSCPYTIKTLYNCKYAIFDKIKELFCGNLSTSAHFYVFFTFFE